MAEVNAQALQAALQQLLAFDGSGNGLNAVRTAMQTAFGETWREAVVPQIQRYDDSTQTRLLEKLDQALSIEAAHGAWEAAHEFVGLPPDEVDREALGHFLDRFEHWLPQFGEPGAALLEQVRQRARTLDLAAPVPEEAGAVPAQGDADQLGWAFNDFLDLVEHMERTQSRIAARCIRLGGIAMEAYPHYGYLVDVYAEILETGEALLNTAGIDALAADHLQGGRAGMEALLKDCRLYYEDSTETEGERERLADVEAFRRQVAVDDGDNSEELDDSFAYADPPIETPGGSDAGPVAEPPTTPDEEKPAAPAAKPAEKPAANPLEDWLNAVKVAEPDTVPRPTEAAS